MEREREREGERGRGRKFIGQGKGVWKEGIGNGRLLRGHSLARVQTRSVAPELCARLTSNRSLPRWRPPRWFENNCFPAYEHVARRGLIGLPRVWESLDAVRRWSRLEEETKKKGWFRGLKKFDEAWIVDNIVALCTFKIVHPCIEWFLSWIVVNWYGIIL